MSLAAAQPAPPVLNASAAGGINLNKALWEKGDFTRLAATMRESGDALIESLGVTAGLDVLDLGCGDGTTALPAAQRGANVLGIDIAANLVAAGNARARAAGLANLCFEEGDASRLEGQPDGSFDLLVSMFGAMFAPRPEATAKEMVRVTRPGGRIVMGNWIPGDSTLIARVLQTCAAYAPPPPSGFVSPMTWGQESVVRERFGAAGVEDDRIACEPSTYAFRYPGPASDFLALFRDYYGPTMNAFEAAERSGRRDALQKELETLFEQQNHGGASRTLMLATFLKVTVQR